jgi:hypothetical protein
MSFTAVMRHFVLGAALTPASLPRRVPTRTLQSTLVACADAAQRLLAKELRTRPVAVDIAVIALRAEAHLHSTTAAVIEPVDRLLQ